MLICVGKSTYEKRAIRREIRKLHEAVKKNEITKLKDILASEIDVNFHYGGQTALQLAVKQGCFAISEVCFYCFNESRLAVCAVSYL